VCNHPYINCVE